MKFKTIVIRKEKKKNKRRKSIGYSRYFFLSSFFRCLLQVASLQIHNLKNFFFISQKKKNKLQRNIFAKILQQRKNTATFCETSTTKLMLDILRK